MPLDQGELVSSYVTTGSDGPSLDDLATVYREAYADEAFVEVASAPPGIFPALLNPLNPLGFPGGGVLARVSYVAQLSN